FIRWATLVIGSEPMTSPIVTREEGPKRQVETNSIAGSPARVGSRKWYGSMRLVGRIRAVGGLPADWRGSLPTRPCWGYFPLSAFWWSDPLRAPPASVDPRHSIVPARTPPERSPTRRRRHRPFT